MEHAAKGGYIDIIKLMIHMGANNYDKSMEHAAINGYIDIVKLMLEMS